MQLSSGAVVSCKLQIWDVSGDLERMRDKLEALCLNTHGVVFVYNPGRQGHGELLDLVGFGALIHSLLLMVGNRYVERILQTNAAEFLQSVFELLKEREREKRLYSLTTKMSD